MLAGKNEKEIFLFKHLNWVMEQIDLEDFCNRMGWKISRKTSEHIITSCPVHIINTGLPSRHKDRFFIDRRKGLTDCKSGCGGGNLLRIVMQLRRCSAQEAYEFIVGKENAITSHAGIVLAALQRKCSSVAQRNRERQRTSELDAALELEVDDYSEIRYEMAHPHMGQAGYDYFMYPPGKKPSLITKETVDHFKVSQRDSGFFANRVIIPVVMKRKVSGYAAIDILGEQEWLRRNPTLDAKDYKKIRFPKGFQSSSCLFNYDDIEDGAEYIIVVEGPRDAMKFWQLGHTQEQKSKDARRHPYKNVCSLFGTNISQEQMERLSEKYPDKIIVALDGDDAGYAAATKIGKKLLPSWTTVELALPPRGFDPKTMPDAEVEKMMKNLQKVKV